MATRTDPTRNQAEYGTPQVSRTGLTLQANLPVLDAGGYPTFLPYRRIGMPGRYGDAGNVDSVAIPVVHRKGYAGIAPLELQPELNPPPPWEG